MGIMHKGGSAGEKHTKGGAGKFLSKFVGSVGARLASIKNFEQTNLNKNKAKSPDSIGNQEIFGRSIIIGF